LNLFIQTKAYINFNKNIGTVDSGKKTKTCLSENQTFADASILNESPNARD
jgi:hypothetical protein